MIEMLGCARKHIIVLGFARKQFILIVWRLAAGVFPLGDSRKPERF